LTNGDLNADIFKKARTNKQADVSVVMSADSVLDMDFSGGIRPYYFILRSGDISKRVLDALPLRGGFHRDIAGEKISMFGTPDEEPVRLDLDILPRARKLVDVDRLYRDESYLREMDFTFLGESFLEPMAELYASKLFEFRKALSSGAVLVCNCRQRGCLARFLEENGIRVVSEEGLSDEFGSVFSGNVIYVEKGMKNDWFHIFKRRFGSIKAMSFYLKMSEISLPFETKPFVRVFYPEGIRTLFLDAYIYHKARGLPTSRGKNIKKVSKRVSGKNEAMRKYKQTSWLNVENMNGDVIRRQAHALYGEAVKYVFQKAVLEDGITVENTLRKGFLPNPVAKADIYTAYGIPFLMSQSDAFLLARIRQSAKLFTGIASAMRPQISAYLKNKQKIILAGEQFEVMETPGHTPGSVSFYNRKQKSLFVGDLMFAAGGVGRTDFSYCSFDSLKKSIQKILKLPRETRVYSGHGPQTTIRAESAALKRNFL
jgi:hypothetical protein